MTSVVPEEPGHGGGRERRQGVLGIGLDELQREQSEFLSFIQAEFI